MRKTIIMAILLAGCSAAPESIVSSDDAANPAKLGTWRVVTTAENMTINDPSASGDGHPVQQQQLDAMGSRSTITCGEPSIDSVERLLSFYPKDIKMKDCEISDMTKEGTSQRAVMACEGDVPEGKPSQKITVTNTLELAENKSRAESEIYVEGITRTGETGNATVSFTHRFERIGDCA